jgi:hypothetical protein
MTLTSAECGLGLAKCSCAEDAWEDHLQERRKSWQGDAYDADIKLDDAPVGCCTVVIGEVIALLELNQELHPYHGHNCDTISLVSCILDTSAQHDRNSQEPNTENQHNLNLLAQRQL